MGEYEPYSMQVTMEASTTFALADGSHLYVGPLVPTASGKTEYYAPELLIQHSGERLAPEKVDLLTAAGMLPGRELEFMAAVTRLIDEVKEALRSTALEKQGEWKAVRDRGVDLCNQWDEMANRLDVRWKAELRRDVFSLG